MPKNSGTVANRQRWLSPQPIIIQALSPHPPHHGRHDTPMQRRHGKHVQMSQQAVHVKNWTAAWSRSAAKAVTSSAGAPRPGARRPPSTCTATACASTTSRSWRPTSSTRGAKPAPATACAAVLGGVEAAQPEGSAATWNQPWLRIPLQKPADGVTPGRPGLQLCRERRFGGRPRWRRPSYELLVKWQPTNAHDNSQRGYTGNTYIDAYRLDGTRLWRIDLGEHPRRRPLHDLSRLRLRRRRPRRVMMKTADGSVDGRGKVIGDAGLDHRNKDGYVLAGPEFLTVFDGRSGAALASTDYLPARGDGASPGATPTATGSTASSAASPTSTARARARSSRAATTRAPCWRPGTGATAS
jgi:hypothetical protein